jgi:hypothetical protein
LSKVAFDLLAPLVEREFEDVVGCVLAVGEDASWKTADERRVVAAFRVLGLLRYTDMG